MGPEVILKKQTKQNYKDLLTEELGVCNKAKVSLHVKDKEIKIHIV